MRFSSLLGVGLLLGAATASYGQGLPGAPTKQSHPPKQIKVLPVPVLFYQQETGFGYGLGALASGRLGQDTLTRSSNARVQYWRTTEKQSLAQFVHTIYGPNEKYYLNGEVSAYVNRLYFFGVGNETTDNSKRSFLDFDLFIVNQRVQAGIGRYQFLGAQYRLSRVYNQVPEPGRVSDTGEAINLTTPNYFTIDPRVTARERQNFSLSGIGPVYTYDSRDVALAASKGNLLDLQVMFNGGFVGSDYNFIRYQVDARHYQRIFSDKTILALQVLGQFHTGDVPWYGLAGVGANLGGTLYNNANLMRGTYEQRFRDRQLITAQAELRQHLFWRIDGAAFVGVGQVGKYLNDYTFGGIHTTGGLGARFNFIRRDRVNLRFDYAFGTDPGFYFAIGEAF